MSLLLLLPLTIRIAFMGDINPGGVLTFTGGVDEAIIQMLDDCDLRVATLESSLGDSIPFCEKKMSDPKMGNIIYSPDTCVSLFGNLGINAVTLANNHALDCGLEGLSHTIEVLDNNHIAHFGAGRDSVETITPYCVTIKNKSFCFLGYYPSEWRIQYPPSAEHGGQCQFEIERVIEDVKKYKEIYDYVFVLPHWGKERTIWPIKQNVLEADRIIEAGATGVIGSHTHTVQPVIKKNNGIIAMSLGNFIFPDRYINTPRVTCYPTEAQRKEQNIPVTYGYPSVQQLTYKSVPKNGRIGMICEIIIDENGSLDYRNHYTILDSEHILRFKDLGFFHKMKLWFVSLWEKLLLFLSV